MTNREYMMTLNNEKLVDFINKNYNQEWFKFYMSEDKHCKKITDAHMVEWLGLDRKEK